MAIERNSRTTLLIAILCSLFALAGCGQRPPVETTILPAADDTATPFLNVEVSPTSVAPTFTPSNTPEPPTPLPTVTALAPTLEPLATPSPTLGVIAPSTTPLGTPSITTTIPATITTTLALFGTVTPSPTPCFGSISGSVVADLNKNGQAEAGEPGILGAKLFLYNSSGVVGVYTTGNGQFYFPGLVAGTYTLTTAPPVGFAVTGPASYDLQVKCGATTTQNILLNASNGTVSPTTQSRGKITPVVQAQGTPRASKSDNGTSNFKPFEVAAVYNIAGCTSINGPGLYRLTTSLTSQWDCIQIASDNVIFDCQGFALNGTDWNGYGVVVHQVGNLLSQRPARNIEIRNCNISKHKYGVFIDAADNLYVHDNNLSNNFRDTDARNFGVFLGLTEGGGIRVGTTTNALIANNRTDNNAIGIDVRTGSGITVRGNTANGNSAWGVHFYNVQFSEVSGNSASDNLRYCTWGNGTVGPGCDAGGIMLQAGSSKNVVRDNTIVKGNGNGIFIKAHGTPCGDGNVIQNNTIRGALYNAIELSFCRDNTIAGNHISDALDGIWLGFAKNNTVNAGNELRDLSNHGIISWNSAENNISTNTIINSREGLYFYSSDYDRQQFFFVDGTPADHISTGNCLCDNTLVSNAVAAIHLNNSLKNQITDNKLTNNGVNFVMEGNTAGNIIENNIIQGGSFNIPAQHLYYAAFFPSFNESKSEYPVFVPSAPNALTAYDMHGNILTRAEFLRAIWTDSPSDSFDLRWFKWKLRISLASK